MESGTANLLHMLHDRVRQLCQAGRWDEAKNAAGAAVEKARSEYQVDPENIDELSFSLEVQGDFYRQYGVLEEARKSYFEALDLLKGKDSQTEAMARLSASVAVVYETDGNTDEAVAFYKRSIDLFERMDPPSAIDIASLCNNLAYIYKSCGDFDAAETLYLKALELYNEQLGSEDEETAAICNNIGALYLAAGCYDQAREMFVMALDARQKVFGDKHIETAQAYANLAVALSHTGEEDLAKKNYQASLKIYEDKVKEAPMDYATVSANFAEFLRSNDDAKAASSVEKRASKMLKKAH
ncbi:MAG: tetratricopeptide repeat protein [Akkermansiaceae bacterium]|nr:tetratricopeptide repeat protein [Akkermansiaceae bacterium]